MAEIIPAIMPVDFEDLRRKLELISDIVPFVQIDIMDGLFVEGWTWPYTPGGPQEFSEYSEGREKFPFSDKIRFEVDLMVANPKVVIDDWVRAGASRVIVHVESVKNLDEFMSSINEDISSGRLTGAEFGLALNTTTDNELVVPFLEKIDIVQCMGIKEIGFQGNPYDERVIEKIKFFKGKAKKISVDGAVNLENAEDLIKAGADILVSGSAIFESDDIVKTIEEFQSI